MNYFFALAGCLLISICSIAQTTVCLIKGDTVFAGGTDRSCIKSAGKFNFVFDGPLDTTVTATIDRIASASQNFKTFGDSCVLAVKALYTDYFSNILHEDPAYFDQHILGNQASRVVGTACLFGIEDNKPVLIYIVFNMNKGVRHPVVISYSSEQQGMAIFLAGDHPRHKGVVGSLPDRGAVGEIKKVIGIDTDGPVDGTGPPIDVLVVTKKGRMWIRK
ncbi:MAG TPA: hypothetical protein VIM64_06480 [Puia sp.]